jgi:hypothetical protein
VPWVEEHSVPLLTNAIHRWSENTERFLDMWEYDTPHVIDAGGYNVMASYVTQGGDLRSDVDRRDVAEELSTETPFYPYSIDEYHQFLCEHSDEFEWATAMDYACEDRFNRLWNYEDRMEATLDTIVRQYNKVEDDGHPYKLLPVLQGRNVEDYVWFYDRLNELGIPTDHVGLGTVCRLSSETRIVDLEQRIRQRTGVRRLHGFGVKIEAFKHGATFDSADSQAWVWNASNGEMVLDFGDRLRSVPVPNCSKTRTVESFKNYYSYVTRLQQGESDVKYEHGFSEETADSDVRINLGAD